MNALVRLRPLLLVVLVAAVSGSLGCAFGEIRLSDPMRREITFEEAQDRYTVLVRWSKWEEAIGFVHPDVRDTWKEIAPDHRALRFTEYDIKKVDFGEDKRTATAEVSYFAYLPAAMLEVEITETQVWERDGKMNTWFVKPQFNDLDRFAYALE